MKLGFNWVRGPFEMIDALGSDRLRQLMAKLDMPVPEALQSNSPFYQTDGDKGELVVRKASGATSPVNLPEGVVRFHLKRRTLQPVVSNRAASLYAIENDYRLIEFHSKANALTDESMQIVLAAAEQHGKGILVHNDAQHYSAGVDLNAFLALIDKTNWSEMDAFLARFQKAVAALKYAPVPVVGAPSGLALGGGFEVLMHCDQLVMHANTVAGLVESGVGLLPAGGGVKETYLRWYLATGDWNEAAWQAWMNLGYGATASSPQGAERLHYFRPDHDQWVMNRDRLYSRSLHMLDTLSTGYSAPAAPQFVLGSGDILHRMAAFMDEGIARGDFFAHDKTVAMGIASVICSSDGSVQNVTEQQMYQRERQAFVALAQTPQTRVRIHSLLHGGGAVRN